ncbi:MAG: copG metJ [Devosia sp.]|nr:copG metJ [Devosia sp.]
MAKTISVGLDDQLAGFVEEQVTTGRFDTVSEVVQAGLCLLKEQEGRLASLRAALAAGESSGPGLPFDFNAFRAHKLRQES